jgi:hypothetical protein
MQSIFSRDFSGMILDLLPNRTLGRMQLVSKSTHEEATRVLLQAARATFNGIHAGLAQKYTVKCCSVTPDETLVEFVQVYAESKIVAYCKLRVELKKQGRIEVIWDFRAVDNSYHGLVTTGTEHMVLFPRNKKRWNCKIFHKEFHVRPYPEDPAALLCNPFENGLWN